MAESSLETQIDCFLEQFKRNASKAMEDRVGFERPRSSYLEYDSSGRSLPIFFHFIYEISSSHYACFFNQNCKIQTNLELLWLLLFAMTFKSLSAAINNNKFPNLLWRTGFNDVKESRDIFIPFTTDDSFKFIDLNRIYFWIVWIIK